MNNQELSNNITQACQWVPVVKEEMGKVLVGQADLVDRLIVRDTSYWKVSLDWQKHWPSKPSQDVFIRISPEFSLLRIYYPPIY